MAIILYLEALSLFPSQYTIIFAFVEGDDDL